MKKLIYLLLLFVIPAQAQQTLPDVHLSIKGDLHFISPEPIQYVDISNKAIEGDIALPNVLRLRFKDTCYSDAVITIAGQTFMAQYHIWPVATSDYSSIEIQPLDTRSLDISGVSLSYPQLKKLAYAVFGMQAKPKEETKAFGIKGSLNNICSAGDYIFLDVSYQNNTNLSYDIAEIRFKIEDKKVTKASNIQSIELKPELVLFDHPAFDKHYRNIFVFKKMSFPGNKVFNIELSEKPISGRVINLKVSYRDLLEADIIP